MSAEFNFNYHMRIRYWFHTDYAHSVTESLRFLKATQKRYSQRMAILAEIKTYKK
jgi:hypothetical protein